MRGGSDEQKPYEPPVYEAQVVGLLSGRREDLRKGAAFQKGVIFCILAYLVLYLVLIVLGVSGANPLAGVVVGLAAAAAALSGAVFTFLLAVQVCGVGLGVVLRVLALIPCVELIRLLVINGKATSVLKANGIRVGLMGAKSNDLP